MPHDPTPLHRLLRFLARLRLLERAATYYRGVLSALRRGFDVTFYEPDAYERQQHRDLEEDPYYARVGVYRGRPRAPPLLEEAARADVVVKASGVGVLDTELEEAVSTLTRADGSAPVRIFWDVDAPATLGRMDADADDLVRFVCPATTRSSPTAAARRWSGSTRPTGCGAACRSTTPTTPRRTTPSPHRSGSASSRFPRQPPAGPRGPRRRLLHRGGRGTRRSASCSAALAGTTRICPRTSTASATSAPPTTTR